VCSSRAVVLPWSRRIISINRGKLARAGLLTVPAVARSGDRPQLPNLLRRYVTTGKRKFAGLLYAPCFTALSLYTARVPILTE